MGEGNLRICYGKSGYVLHENRKGLDTVSLDAVHLMEEIGPHWFRWQSNAGIRRPCFLIFSVAWF